MDRVATLLVFLHRKIEIQIVKYKKEQENGGLKLLQDIGQELQNTISEGYENGFSIEDSFSFLKPQPGGRDDQSAVSSTNLGDQVMWEVLGKKRLPHAQN